MTDQERLTAVIALCVQGGWSQRKLAKYEQMEVGMKILTEAKLDAWGRIKVSGMACSSQWIDGHSTSAAGTSSQTSCGRMEDVTFHMDVLRDVDVPYQLEYRQDDDDDDPTFEGE